MCRASRARLWRSAGASGESAATRACVPRLDKRIERNITSAATIA